MYRYLLIGLIFTNFIVITNNKRYLIIWHDVHRDLRRIIIESIYSLLHHYLVFGFLQSKRNEEDTCSVIICYWNKCIRLCLIYRRFVAIILYSTYKRFVDYTIKIFEFHKYLHIIILCATLCNSLSNRLFLDFKD